MTKIEQVARAIDPGAFEMFDQFRAYCISDGDSDEKADDAANLMHGTRVDEAKISARTAIAAMAFNEDGSDCAEPIRIAGEEAYHSNGDARAVFNAMIGATLQDETA